VDDNYTHYIPKSKRKTLIGNKEEVNLSPLDLRSIRSVFFISLKDFSFVGLAYQGKDIVFTFIVEYIVVGSLRDFGP
jgi:hypothetical protein